MAVNQWGLDVRYFKEKLGQLVRDAQHYPPQEMELALTRLAKVAKEQNKWGDNTSGEPND